MQRIRRASLGLYSVFRVVVDASRVAGQDGSVDSWVERNAETADRVTLEERPVLCRPSHAVAHSESLLVRLWCSNWLHHLPECKPIDTAAKTANVGSHFLGVRDFAQRIERLLTSVGGVECVVGSKRNETIGVDGVRIEGTTLRGGDSKDAGHDGTGTRIASHPVRAAAWRLGWTWIFSDSTSWRRASWTAFLDRRHCAIHVTSLNKRAKHLTKRKPTHQSPFARKSIQKVVRSRRDAQTTQKRSSEGMCRSPDVLEMRLWSGTKSKDACPIREGAMASRRFDRVTDGGNGRNVVQMPFHRILAQCTPIDRCTSVRPLVCSFDRSCVVARRVMESVIYSVLRFFHF